MSDIISYEEFLSFTDNELKKVHPDVLNLYYKTYNILHNATKAIIVEHLNLETFFNLELVAKTDLGATYEKFATFLVNNNTCMPTNEYLSEFAKIIWSNNIHRKCKVNQFSS